MCKACEEAGIDVEEQRKTVAREVSERSGVDVETTMKVLLAIEAYREDFEEQRKAEYLERARAANPDLFALLEAAGAEFTVQEAGPIAINVDGEPVAAPAHIRDVQGSGGYL
jgi:hypothetical protein